MLLPPDSILPKHEPLLAPNELTCHVLRLITLSSQRFEKRMYSCHFRKGTTWGKYNLCSGNVITSKITRRNYLALRCVKITSCRLFSQYDIIPSAMQNKIYDKMRRIVQVTHILSFGNIGVYICVRG